MPPDRPRGRGQRPLKVTGTYFYPNNAPTTKINEIPELQ